MTDPRNSQLKVDDGLDQCHARTVESHLNQQFKSN